LLQLDFQHHCFDYFHPWEQELALCKMLIEIVNA